MFGAACCFAGWALQRAYAATPSPASASALFTFFTIKKKIECWRGCLPYSQQRSIAEEVCYMVFLDTLLKLCL